MELHFEEAITRYHGQKQRVAVILAGATRIQMTLADTARCAVDLEAARRTLVNLVGERLISDGAENGLQAQCRILTKWKERKPRY